MPARRFGRYERAWGKTETVIGITTARNRSPPYARPLSSRSVWIGSSAVSPSICPSRPPAPWLGHSTSAVQAMQALAMTAAQCGNDSGYRRNSFVAWSSATPTASLGTVGLDARSASTPRPSSPSLHAWRLRFRTRPAWGGASVQPGKKDVSSCLHTVDRRARTPEKSVQSCSLRATN
jgi:hypothetical protein